MTARPASVPALNTGYRTLRRLALLAAVSLVVGAPMGASALLAQEAAMPEVKNAAQAFRGQITTPSLVRAGPGTNYYETMKLQAGAEVVVVGISKDWLKIVPPEGSFSLVPKAFVNAHGAGKQGTVTNQLLVKAGSSLGNNKWAAQAKLEPNDRVAILGEEDEYFKITPPEGSYLYIQKDGVKPIGPANVKPAEAAALPQPTPPTPPTGLPGVASSAETTPKITETPTSPAPTSRPTVVNAGEPAAPSTQPSVAAMLTELQNLETEFTDISKLPLAEQSVADLLARYQAYASKPGVPEMAKRIADVRVSTLGVRNEAKEQFAEVQKRQQEMAERNKIAAAEREEINERIKATDIQVYAAVGTLRTSSLQISRTPLYRLTDPETGRTVVYVWGTDPKVGELVGQFIGVKGPMQTDPRLNLKVVTPSGTDVVDPAKVNTSVAAEIVPPSLLPKTPTASTGGQ